MKYLKGELYNLSSVLCPTQNCSVALGELDSQVMLLVKNPSPNAGDMRDASSIPGLGRSPGGGHGNPPPVFLRGESHGQRSLMNYSPRVGHN